MFSSACASLTAEEEEFYRRYSRFLTPGAREVYLGDSIQRPELERVARTLAAENVRPDFLDAVLEGEIALGMTTVEVSYAIGPPRRRASAAAGGRTEDWWTYVDGEAEQTFVFQNDSLVSFELTGAGPSVGIGPEDAPK